MLWTKIAPKPLEHGGGSARVQNATAELFGESNSGQSEKGSASSADARGESANGVYVLALPRIRVYVQPNSDDTALIYFPKIYTPQAIGSSGLPLKCS